MRTSLLFVLLACVAAPLHAQPPKPPVRVYIWTARAEVADQEQKLREDSVRDLIAKLDRRWLVVSSQDASEIQVEITRSEQTGTVYLDPVPSWSGRRPVPILSVFATLRSDDSSTELVCTIGDKTPTWLRSAHTPTWKDAAAVCAKKTKAWVQANLKQLRPGETPKK
jgi:hypothetical protein